MSDIKYISGNEFRDEGYLQEVNRLFFHPLGLALEIYLDHDGKEFVSGVRDHRDDLEGVRYDKDQLSVEKAENVKREESKRLLPRVKKLGYIYQPVYTDPQKSSDEHRERRRIGDEPEIRQYKE